MLFSDKVFEKSKQLCIDVNEGKVDQAGFSQGIKDVFFMFIEELKEFGETVSKYKNSEMDKMRLYDKKVVNLCNIWDFNARRLEKDLNLSVFKAGDFKTYIDGIKQEAKETVEKENNG